MALTFYFYEALGRQYDALLQQGGGGAAPGAARSLVCGGLGGGLAKLLTYPLDTVKKRMQVHPALYPSTARALLRIARSAEGPGGLFKGLAPALGKAAASSALGFGCYEGAARGLRWLALPLLVEAQREE